MDVVVAEEVEASEPLKVRGVLAVELFGVVASAEEFDDDTVLESMPKVLGPAGGAVVEVLREAGGTPRLMDPNVVEVLPVAERISEPWGATELWRLLVLAEVLDMDLGLKEKPELGLWKEGTTGSLLVVEEMAELVRQAPVTEPLRLPSTWKQAILVREEAAPETDDAVEDAGAGGDFGLCDKVIELGDGTVLDDGDAVCSDLDNEELEVVIGSDTGTLEDKTDELLVETSVAVDVV